MGGFFIDLLLGYFFRDISNCWKAVGSTKWPSAQAIVTADPVKSTGFGGTKVEIVYSYRVDGELYTGAYRAVLGVGL